MNDGNLTEKYLNALGDYTPPSTSVKDSLEALALAAVLFINVNNNPKELLEVYIRGLYELASTLQKFKS